MTKPRTAPAPPAAAALTEDPPAAVQSLLPATGGAWEVVDGRLVQIEEPTADAAGGAVQAPVEGAVQ